MSVGYLTQYIKIQEAFDIIDHSGSRTKSWKDTRECWAHIEEVHKKRYLESNGFVGGVVSTKNYYEVTLRPSNKTNNGTRILWKNKKLHILKHCEPCNQQRFIKFIAVEEF